jgi:uncharacterized repeat protein (TIGR02543 family)
MEGLEIIYVWIALFILILIILIISLINYQNLVKTLRYILHGIKVDLESNDVVQLAIAIWRIEKGFQEIKEIDLANKKKLESALRKAKDWLSLHHVTYKDYAGENPEGKSKVIEVISITEKTGEFVPFISNTLRPEIKIDFLIVLKSRVDITQPRPKKVFTIVFNPDGGNKPIPSRSCEEGLELNENDLEVPQWDGHQFTGWYDIKTNTAMSFPFKIARDLSLIASWKEIELAVKVPTDDVTLTYKENKEDKKELGHRNLPKNSVVEAPLKLEKIDFNFLGWFDQSNDEKITFPLKVDVDKNLYGKWEKKTQIEQTPENKGNDVVTKKEIKEVKKDERK